jgi:PAS domain S-box-containing protein
MDAIIVAYTPLLPRGAAAAAAIGRLIMTVPASLPNTGSSDDFRSIFEMSAVPIVQVDLRTGRFLRVNEAFCRLLGYAAHELLDTKSVLDITHPDDREPSASQVRALASEVVEQLDIEKRYVCRDGTIRWGLTCARISTHEGRPVATAVIQDVTARRDIEASLREANRRMTQVLESVGDGFVWLDRNWRYTYVNEAAVALLRRSRESLINQAVWHGFPQAMRERFEYEFTRAVRENHPVTFEAYHAPPIDAWYECRAHPTPEGLAVFLSDVTQRRRADEGRRLAEQRVQQQLAEISAIYDSAPVGLCVLDRDLRYVRLNERLAEFNGSTVAEHLGRTVWEVVPEVAAQVEPTIRRVLETGKPVLGVQVSSTTRARPGEQRTWIVHWLPLHDVQGEVTGINVVTEEITELKSVEQRLREADQVKDQFLVMLGHEMRQPLNALQAASQVARLCADSDRILRPLDVIERQVAHLARLVDDLTDASRIKRGKLLLQRQRCDLRGIVDAAVDTVSATAAANDLALVVRHPDGPVTIDGDPHRLRQVLLNLLSNAMKHTPRQGRITVTLEKRDQAAVLTVSDTGRGIAADLLPRVFDLFVQASDAQTSGMGIGLSLVKGIVELHEGTVEASSDGEGRGSTFTVRIPLPSD